MVALTIGMPTYNDFDGVYFTIQALRLHHDLSDTELLVVDNFGCEQTRKFVEESAKGRYVLNTDQVGTATAKNLVFQEATGEAVLCCDSHVMFAPGAIARLKKFYQENPASVDLLQGPLMYDDFATICTHFEPVWRGQMWGIWASDPRGQELTGEPFEIPMQGMGVFSCRKGIWPGFNPRFRGFGGEEGYIHEKVRQAGGRCLCLPWLRWIHRFGRPAGVPYPLTVEDKLRNYLIGHDELGLDPRPVLEHFSEHLPGETIASVTAEALWGVAPGPARSRPGPPSNTEEPAKSLSKPKKPSSPQTRRPMLVKKAAAAGIREDLNTPLVSCICPTFGRPPAHQHLLEEAIESFLRQDYPKKELLVINDCPDQTLVCDAPGVRVINESSRYRTLGEKYNAAIQAARGDLFAPWEDDDISLPWRLSLSVERLGNARYFNPRLYWFWDRDGLHFDHAMGVGHNLSLFTRSAFDQVGGYTEISGPQDLKMDTALRSEVGCIETGANGELALTRSEWYYIYRWDVQPWHLSGRVATEDFYREVGTLPVEPGRFHLHPHWEKDYSAITRQLVVDE